MSLFCLWRVKSAVKKIDVFLWCYIKVKNKYGYFTMRENSFTFWFNC